MALQQTIPPQRHPCSVEAMTWRRPGRAYTQPVITAFRRWIYRLLAFCVFVLTLGRVHVNTTGRATVDEPGRDDTNISAKKGTR